MKEKNKTLREAIDDLSPIVKGLDAQATAIREDVKDIAIKIDNMYIDIEKYKKLEKKAALHMKYIEIRLQERAKRKLSKIIRV